MFKKKVILSFDYELFFGDKSGTVQKTLIEPTNAILEAMDSVGFKGNFFVDWQMLKYLKEQNTERTQFDYKLIKDQLKDIVKRGHRIELHIHPHWVDAKYNGDGTWDYSDFHHYSLHSFSEKEVIDMFREGASLLTSIAQEVDPSYELCAFRAGGWAVQPFNKIKKGMEAVGIYIDSSVMPGRAIICEFSECDFLSAPHTKKGYYNFDDDVCKENKNGRFTEVAITSFRPNILYKLTRRVSWVFVNRFQFYADGTHKRIHGKPDIWINPDQRELCTFCTQSPLNIIMQCLLYKGSLMCFIDHPKDITDYTTKNIKLLSKFASSITYKDLL